MSLQCFEKKKGHRMRAEDAKVGSFQVVLLFLLGINYVIVSMNHALPNFHSHTPNFYCKVKGSVNSTNACVTSLEKSTVNMTGSISEKNAEYSSCETGYRFDSVRGETTIVTEWGLICERRYLLPLSTMLYLYGVVIGAWIAGVLTDRVGRLPVLAMCLYTQGTLAVALYIIQDYRAFLVVRALQGVFVQGLQISTYTLLLELFPVRSRTLVSMTLQFGWAIGLLLLAGLSYAVADWRVLQLATSVPTAVTVLYIWIIPESPRWLLAKGNLTEAHMALEKIAKYNTCCRKREVKVEAEMEEGNTTTITETVTPVKPKRKSRVSNVDPNETKTNDSLTEESSDLLTTPELSDGRIIVGRKFVNVKEENNVLTPSESLERRASNLEMQMKFEMTVGDEGMEERDPTPPPPAPLTPNGKDSQSSNGSDDNQEVSTIIPEEIVELRTAEAVPQKEEEDTNESLEKNKEDVENKSEVANNQTFLQLLRRPGLRRNCMILIFVWFSVSLSHCGFVFQLPDISGDRHVNFAIGGCLDLIAYSLTHFVLIKCGRRIPLGIYLILSGATCIVIAAISMPMHENSTWTGPTKLTLILIGKGAIVSSFAVTYLYTVELFPTVLRGTCLGYCEIFGKIGTLIAPHFTVLGTKTWAAVPISIMGTLCVVSGILSLALPETLNNRLPDTIEQSEDLFKRNRVRSTEEGSVKKTNNKRRTVLDEQNERDILREKLFNDDNDGKTWVEAGNGIIVNFSDGKNTE
ncbi:organic cation transporter protein-like [Neodiprion lecontei]|uniref:Organic cation transporter protein-like n=1 Tax=Neodiprion lecontei TaxID=441921 RepID=A0A6J0BG09_NEOLC|nr:organic cation transporter protein-like [Neodiprion lecontei]